VEISTHVDKLFKFNLSQYLEYFKITIETTQILNSYFCWNNSLKNTIIIMNIRKIKSAFGKNISEKKNIIHLC
jgi:hypothetical protein